MRKLSRVSVDESGNGLKQTEQWIGLYEEYISNGNNIRIQPQGYSVGTWIKIDEQFEVPPSGVGPSSSWNVPFYLAHDAIKNETYLGSFGPSFDLGAYGVKGIVLRLRKKKRQGWVLDAAAFG